MEDEFLEDLRWQAIRGLQLGRTLCDCDDRFHLLWAPLRAAGFFGGQKSEVPELAAILKKDLKNETRILIAGAADPGSLTTIKRLSAPSDIDVTILDRCNAPLRLIDEFARPRNVTCDTIQMDILDIDTSPTWDVVFLHYLIPFIEYDLHELLFARLAQSLTRNGVLLCVNQIAEYKSPDEFMTLEDAWLNNARRALTSSGYSHYYASNELDLMLRAFAKARTHRRLQGVSHERLCQLIEKAGLRICQDQKTARKFELKNDGGVYDHESSRVIKAARET